MANLLNTITCLIIGQNNTRLPKCFTEPARLKYMLLTPKGYIFPFASTANIPALQTALIAICQNDVASTRAYRFGKFEIAAPTGEAAQVETASGSGRKRTTRGATIGFKFTMWDGGIDYQMISYTFDGQFDAFDAILFDEKLTMYANWVNDATGNPCLTGFDLNQLDISNYNWTEGNAGGNFTIDIGLSNANEMNSNLAIIQTANTGFDLIAATEGFYNFTLSGTSSSATAVNMTAKVGMVDAKPTYDNALNQLGAWSAVNLKPGSADYGDAITISAVAKSGSGWALTLAAAGTDPDNPGSGEYIGVSLVEPSQLALLSTPVVDIESNEARVKLA